MTGISRVSSTNNSKGISSEMNTTKISWNILWIEVAMHGQKRAPSLGKVLFRQRECEPQGSLQYSQVHSQRTAGSYSIISQHPSNYSYQLCRSIPVSIPTVLHNPTYPTKLYVTTVPLLILHASWYYRWLLIGWFECLSIVVGVS